ncbi:MAG TPA: glycosyltransferase family 39 protein [Vicinamibacteria bacterium]|nr:glycosyltransferase family 39 protein [Vicinamibacteria bacterium]
MSALRCRVAAASVLVIAAAGIVSTYRTLSLTVDEPTHVEAGLEWLDHGSYRLQPENPPLSRLPVAIGPYLRGYRLPDVSGRTRGQALDALDTEDNRDLALARVGVLPLFLLCGALVWAGARSLFGEAVALVAVTLFASVPAVLAHAGLATTDVAFTAAYLAALLAFVRWLDRPTLGRGLLLGALTGAAFATKFTAVALVPAAAAILAVRAFDRGARWGGLLTRLPLLILAALLVLGAAYRFDVGRPVDERPPQEVRSLVDSCAAPGSLSGKVLARLTETPVPAPALLTGLLELCVHNAQGHPAFLMGRVSPNGFALYYPLALLVKSPIPFLLLAGSGVVLVLRRHRGWRPLAPVLAAATLLAFCSLGRINIGVRHVLPVFPLLCIPAAAAAHRLWTAGRVARAAVLALGAWQIAAPIVAYPHWLGYFNEAAAPHAARILTDSDLDWGQDLYALRDALRERHVPELWIAYFGKADLCRHRLPPARWLAPGRRVTGWVALSEMQRVGLLVPQFEGDDPCDRDRLVWREGVGDGYAWLDAYQPLVRVGRSIRLYYIDQ